MKTILETNEVHLWQISLARDAGKSAWLGESLNADERSRAARFHFPEDRERFVMARGSLRRILAMYLHQPPETIRFCYGARGRPELDMEASELSFDFNLSHSREVGLCALARGRRVGVDVEQIRPESVDSLEIAEQHFTAAETECIRSSSPASRMETFFRFWTRKEACLKGTGQGLGTPLNYFEVSLDSPAVEWRNQDIKPRAEWSVQEIRPCPEYVAALAVDWPAPEIEITKMNFPGGYSRAL